MKGAPPRIAILLGAGPIEGSSIRLGTKSTSHRSTTGQPVTGHPVTSQPVTSQAVTGQPGTSQPGTGHPGTSQQLFTIDFQSPISSQYIANQPPVIVPQHSYAPSISSHVSHCSKRRLPNIQHTGYEHSNIQEFPNPATS